MSDAETMAPPAGAEAARAPEMLSRRAAMQPSTFDAEARTVELTWTTGADVQRRDFWTGEVYVERLAVSRGSVDLSRLNAGAPLLDTHSSFGLGSVIGVVERAWLDGAEGRALVRFSDREDVQPIVQDVRAGVIRNVSVGYSVQEWKDTEASAKGPRVREAVRWTPMELSLVPIPADAKAQIRAAAPATDPRDADHQSQPVNRGAAPLNPEARMSEAEVQPGAQAPDLPATRAMEPAAPASAPLQVLESIASRAGLGSDWVLAQIKAGATELAARDAAIDAVAARQQAPAVTGAVTVIRDEGDTLRRGIEEALEARLANSRMPLDGPGADWRGSSLIDMGRALLDQRGVRTVGWARADVARAMLGLPVLGRSMQTTSDFASLLGNVQSKRLLASYDAAPRTFTSWTAERQLPDFKSTTVVELGAAPALSALAEGGTITLGAIQDSGESYQLVRYARNVALSYPAIVNDDLSGFDRLPQAFATATANIENAVVYGILETNAAMSDSIALFNASHSNTAAGSMDVAGVTAARAQILRQTDPTGQRMMVMPNLIIVPVELGGTARALFSATVVPSGVATTAVNPWRGEFEIVETNFLTDTNDYFVTVRRGSGYEAVEVGYEAGNSAPQLATFTQPDVDGMVFSLRHSFGAKAVTWRTIARVTA